MGDANAFSPDCAVHQLLALRHWQPGRLQRQPALARRQGAWAVIAQGGVILRRGHELEQVLKVFDARKFRVVD